jgi:pyruvate ferredoxin oxidoreductase gamma subunit
MALTEIRWHGRGGQGVKTAALLVAEAAVELGGYAQGFPEYGPERAGAPVRGYTRISDKEIRMHCAIEHPNVVVVLDELLIGSEDVCEGLHEDGVLIVNTPRSPEQLKSNLGITGQRIYTVDASGISRQEIGRPIPNVPLIGALARATNLFSLEEMKQDLRKKFSHRYSDRIVEGNLRALERAYREVRSC